MKSPQSLASCKKSLNVVTYSDETKIFLITKSEGMKSQYAFEIKKGYLQVNITGIFDNTELLAIPEIIKAECEKEKIYKVLLNGLNLKGTDISTADRYFLGEKIGLEFRNYIKLAVVWPEKDIDKFAETVALNRGGKMLVVGDLSTAEEWLLKSPV